MKPVPVAGIDVRKEFSDMCILAPDNGVFRRIKIFHYLASMQRSLGALREAEVQFGSQPVIAMEATLHYHRLLWQLMSDAGYEVLAINPIQTGGLKNIDVRKLKNDKVDAHRIATPYRLFTNSSIRLQNIPQRNRASAKEHLRLQCVDIYPNIHSLIPRYCNRREGSHIFTRPKHAASVYHLTVSIENFTHQVYIVFLGVCEVDSQ